jgi:dTDP-L-rhamnose 4-epimerase
MQLSRLILVTGGAGFIGRHLVRALLARGDRVRVLDSLHEQVHADAGSTLPREVEFLHGDVRDMALVQRALRGVDQVVHLAAEVGVGQSMYAIDRYVSVNDLGTAVLFQALTEQRVARVVTASSMSIYGEGLYRTRTGALREDVVRPEGGRAGGGWDPVDEDGVPLTPLPTPEGKRPNLASVYALTKFVQEQMTLNVCAAYGMQGVALRLFNVYGPGQALSNPYTGVLAIFAARLLNRQRPMVFEDGRQLRDFVHVSDVARAFLLALDLPQAAGGTFNIGSGQSIGIAEVAGAMASAMERPELTPDISGQARTGDIRHCIADISRARAVLGFEPQRDFHASLAELAEWVGREQAIDRVAQARRELEARGLVA